jgi:hypothetical protein
MGLAAVPVAVPQGNLRAKLAAQERLGKVTQAATGVLLMAAAAAELAAQADLARRGRERLARGPHRLYLVRR